MNNVKVKIRNVLRKTLERGNSEHVFLCFAGFRTYTSDEQLLYKQNNRQHLSTYIVRKKNITQGVKYFY